MADHPLARSCHARNHNPIALLLDPAAKRPGSIPPSRNTDGEFEQFESVAFGLQAAVLQLRGYVRQQHADTLAKLVFCHLRNRRLPNRAPLTDKDMVSYMARVGRVAGFRPDQRLDFLRAENLKPVLQALISVETCRKLPSDAEINAVLASAGIPFSPHLADTPRAAPETRFAAIPDP
nr:uncharacterized protein [uncultured bacterium]